MYIFTFIFALLIFFLQVLAFPYVVFRPILCDDGSRLDETEGIAITDLDGVVFVFLLHQARDSVKGGLSRICVFLRDGPTTRDGDSRRIPPPSSGNHGRDNHSSECQSNYYFAASC